MHIVFIGYELDISEPRRQQWNNTLIYDKKNANLFSTLVWVVCVWVSDRQFTLLRSTVSSCMSRSNRPEGPLPCFCQPLTPFNAYEVWSCLSGSPRAPHRFFHTSPDPFHMLCVWAPVWPSMDVTQNDSQYNVWLRQVPVKEHVHRLAGHRWWWQILFPCGAQQVVQAIPPGLLFKQSQNRSLKLTSSSSIHQQNTHKKSELITTFWMQDFCELHWRIKDCICCRHWAICLLLRYDYYVLQLTGCER